MALALLCGITRRRSLVLGVAVATAVALLDPGSAHAATLSAAPVGNVQFVTAGNGGIHVSGWAFDPDTSAAVTVRIYVDGHQKAAVAADRADPVAYRVPARAAGPHGFAATLPATAGIHGVCMTALDRTPAGARPTPPAAVGCRYVNVQVNPVGAVSVAARKAGDTSITVTGWAIDPETYHQISVGISVDRTAPVRVTANQTKPGLAAGFAGIGIHHGYTKVIAVSAGAHTVCVTGSNVLQGVDSSLGCATVAAIPSGVPSVVRSVRAVGLPWAAQLSWVAPGSDGGVAVSSYRITSQPPSTVVAAAASSRSAVVSGLRPATSYRFVVQAVNRVGLSPASPATTTVVVAPVPEPPVTSPPLISTSRYIRNLSAADPAGNRAKTFAMGATDARNNPSNRSYLILLQFGGQSLSGNTQSATANSSLTYAQNVWAMQAYLDGYHANQNANAPVIIAFGTNNDRDVQYATGQLWAQQVVNPLAVHAAGYANISVAGANDIEPGFLGTMSQSQAWLQGYLASTKARFVFNGSADGCRWTQERTSCNNGYDAAGVQWMAGGAAPTRILALPQIYNYTQAKQWKYISLTGAVTGLKMVNFAGPLTEWTACSQAQSCNSMTNNVAWAALWNELNSDARVRPSSLPYGTDLRIN